MRTFALWVIVGVLSHGAWADDLPEVKSASAIVIDARTGAEIFGKDADEIRAIASTTKIFVAMAVRAKGLNLDGYTEITRVDAHEAEGGARTRLEVGWQYRNSDLLRAMLLASDNRAPTALGRAAGMDPDQLVAEMNAIARKLHLTRTKFTDPSGLHGNVSTAREMAIALRAALDDQVLREIMGEDHAEVIAKGHRRGIEYGTTNRPLAAHRRDVIGGKTGYTDAAGYCYITAARFDGREIVMAFLGAQGKLTRFGDFERVAKWIERGAPGAEIDFRHDLPPPPRVELELSGTADP